MLSDSIIYVGIVDTRSYQPWKNQGLDVHINSSLSKS